MNCILCNSGITITLRGIGANRTLNCGFTIESDVTLILDNNITLRNGVTVGSGTLIMNNGSTITGANGNGVSVWTNGTFTMSGGTVSRNTAREIGGGVYVGGGTFTKTGGTIYGFSASDTANSNAAMR